MKHLNLYIVIFILFLAGCMPDYCFRNHWRSRIDYLSHLSDKGAARFELDEFLRIYKNDVRARLIDARIWGVAPEDVEILMYRPAKGDAWGAWRAGLVAEKTGDFKKAIARYTEAAALAPCERTVLASLGNCLFKCGMYKRAMAVYKCVLNWTDAHALPYPLPGGAEGFGLLLMGREKEAMERLSGRLGQDGLTSDFYLALGTACFKEKKYEQGCFVFREAMRRGKLSPECRDIYKKTMHRFLKELRRLKMLPYGCVLARKAVRLFPKEAVMNAHLALFFLEAGRTAAAVREFEKALAKNPYHIEVVQAARLAYVKAGRFSDAFRVWERIIPRDLLLSRANKIRPLIVRVRDRSKKAGEKPAGDRAHLELARAYRDFGWVREARVEYLRFLSIDADLLKGSGTRDAVIKMLKTFSDNPDTAAAIKECRAVTEHMLLLGALEKYFENIYSRLFKGDAVVDIKQALSDIRGLIRKTCDVEIPDGPYWSAVFFGSELNPISSPKSELILYFKKYNQYIEVQEVYSQFPECKLMNILYHAKVERVSLGEKVTYDFYIGDENWVKTATGYMSGRPRVAGSASYSTKGFYLDTSAMRPSMDALMNLLGIVKKRKMPYLEFARTGYRKRAKASGLYFSRELYRTLYQKALRGLGVKMGDSSKENLDRAFQEILTADLENVAAHELGHLRDFKDKIPFLPHMLTNIWVAVSHGLSPSKVSARFETVAETHSIADTSHPYLSAAGTLGWLESYHEKPFHHLLVFFPQEDIEKSPYYYMARNIIGYLVDYVREHPGEFPAVDTGGNVLEQLGKLTGAELRMIARKSLESYGIP
jgi:tetratricopeptide (TPR) repeat protein